MYIIKFIKDLQESKNAKFFSAQEVVKFAFSIKAGEVTVQLQSIPSFFDLKLRVDGFSPRVSTAPPAP